VKCHWLLPIIFCIVLLGSPADAARLKSWRFNKGESRLYFTTDSAVQPKAQLVFNPTRLVIDLPGIDADRRTISQDLRGTVKYLRIAQFDSDTTRIVLELETGYTLDPQKIKFRATNPRQWTVDIPTPVLINSDGGDNSSVSLNSGDNNSAPNPPNRRNPPNRPNFPSRLGSLATIESIELTENNQLLIGADRSINFTTQWESASSYQISIPYAKLSNRLELPRLYPGSPALISVRQDSPQTVVVLVQPVGGVRIDKITQPSTDVIALTLQTNRTLPPRYPRPLPPRYPLPNPDNNNQFPTPDPRPIPNGQLVVVLDAGHGGSDAGAIGIDGIREKEIVLPITQEVSRILQQRGVGTILTRDGDYDVELEPRVQIAESANATVFVSIHANAIDMSRPDVNGIETYYYENGYDMARIIHQNMLEATGGPDRRVRQARFYVLRRTTMPAVLVEIGFVTGEDDAPKLADANYRSQIAAAIARGILQYLQGY
jgi:N-acetylmuramoyl-L-alanine amidase